MKKMAIAALAMAATMPAFAAEPDASPDSDLRCAILAAYATGTATDEKAKQGLGFSMTFFIGRYEGATGRKFEEAATVDYVLKLAPELGSLREPCSERMKSFGERLMVWGQELQKAGEKAK